VDGFRFGPGGQRSRANLHEVDSAGAVFRHHPTGPDNLTGKAYRRALDLGEEATRLGTDPWRGPNGMGR